jgi:hypothetical protein
MGLVTEDVYHGGKLVIPAGTDVHGTAQADRHRERIASGTSWTLVWQSGEELRLKPTVLDREYSVDQEGWGITDGSAGLRGRVIKSDDMSEIKLFAATFLSGATEALTEKQQTVFGPVSSPTLNNAPFEGVQKVLSVYAQRICEAIQRDGFYVRVPSGPSQLNQAKLPPFGLGQNPAKRVELNLCGFTPDLVGEVERSPCKNYSAEFMNESGH